MNQRDVLAEAARALREETARSPRRIAVPRRRDALVERLRARRATARRMTVSMVAALTLLVASSAWAAIAGRLPVAKFVQQILGGHPVGAARSAASVASHAATLAPPAPQSAPEPTTSSPLPVFAPESAHESPSIAAIPAPSLPSPTRRETISVRIDPHDELYRAAHLAQFVQHDPATAVAAWDRYLAVAPHGRFAVEATYNRALSLVRLGQYASARDALTPFARGDHGLYRQHEAQELLARLPPR